MNTKQWWDSLDNDFFNIMSFNNYPIYYNLDKITCLSINGYENIEAIVYLKNLTNLHIGHFHEHFSEYVASLTELRILSLADGYISDLNIISKLKSLTSLISLDLSDNEIVSLEPLVNMPNMLMLQSLDISNNKIINIDCLSEFSYLTNVKILNNKISDISVLSKIKGINYADYVNFNDLQNQCNK